MRGPSPTNRRHVLTLLAGAFAVPLLAGCEFRAGSVPPGIYRVPVGGGDLRLVASDPARPVPSPDGSSVAWSSERGVWIAPIDGTAGPHRIAATSSASVPAWAPDGSLLAWIDREPRTIVVANPAQAQRAAIFALLAPDAAGGLVGIALRNQPSWAPDGSAFAYLAWDGNGDEVYRIAPDGGDRRQLSRIRSSGAPINGEDPNGQTKAIGDAVRPAWSPLGDRVAFAVAPETAGSPGGLFVVDQDGSRQRRLSPLLSGFGPLWSPDGSEVLIVLHGDEGPALCVVDVSTRELQDLTAGSGLTPLDAAWSPDGSRIAFSANGAIHVLDRSTGEVVTVADTPLDDRAPAWTPDGGEILFFASVDLFQLPAMPDIP